MSKHSRLKVEQTYLHKKLSIVSVLKDLGFSVAPNKNFQCVFHADRLASARVYEDTNTVYCFACSKSWNCIDFYSEYKKISKEEAEKVLLSKYGLSKESFGDEAFKDAVSDILATKTLDLFKYRNKIEKQITEFYTYYWKNIRNYALSVLDFSGPSLYTDSSKEEIDNYFKHKQKAFLYLKRLDDGITEEFGSRKD